MSEIDKILEKARKAASAMTNYTAMSLRPRPSTITIKRYETVYLDKRSFVLIMIASGTDSVKTKNIKLDFDVSKDIIDNLSVVLNEVLSGVSIDDINISLIMKIEAKMQPYPEIVSIVVKSIYETMNELGSEIRVEGLNRLLQYPEYKNLDRLQQMISTIEDKSDLIKAVSTIDQSDDETKIFIGSENMVKIMDNSTMIYKNLKLGGKTIGAIAIIGPCRMDYSKVLATIDKLSDEINNLSEIPTNMLPDSFKDNEKR
jgi:heat-inducible transcriptional repressor